LEKKLAALYKRLEDAWKKFQKVHEKSTKIKVEGNKPDRNVILAAINKQQDALDKHQGTVSGKLRNGFRKVCSKIKSHDNVIKILPKDDRYFAIFVGSLITITEVCKNSAPQRSVLTQVRPVRTTII
jgi:hypothetical protein